MAKSKCLKNSIRVGAVALILVGAASCSKSTTSSTATTLATSTSAQAATTTPPTSAAPETSLVTAADLADLLPSAEDIGPDYRIDTESDDDDDSDKTFEKACPEVAELMKMDTDSDSSDIERNFTTDDDRSVGVSISKAIDTTPVANEEKLAKMVDAVNKCGVVHETQNGTDLTVTMSMDKDGSFGDFGGVLTIKMHAESPMLPAPMDIEGKIRVFAVGNVGVMISAIGGVDSDTGVSVPADYDVIATQATRLEQGIADLQGR